MVDMSTLVWVCSLMIVLMLIGVPIAFSLGITGMLGIVLLKGWHFFAGLTALIPYSHVNSWLLVSLPLFVIMGSYADKGGVADKAYEKLYKVIGGIRGGLAIASIAGCASFASITGSSAATAVAVGKISLPQMLRRKYDKKFATGTLASGAFLGIMIPPSAILVIYGFITNASIGKLFMAAIVPGILTGAVFIAGVWVQVKLRPGFAPVSHNVVPIKEKIVSLAGLWEVALLFLVVMVSLYTGIATATEAAAVGAFAALVLLVIHRRKKAMEAAVEGMKETTGIVCMVITITLLGMFFSKFLTLSGIAKLVASSITTISSNRIFLLSLILATYLPMGMCLDGVSMIVITVPIFVPTITSLGYDPIWFGVMVTAMVEISLITPPLGLNLFVVKAVSPEDTSIVDIFIGTIPYLILEIIVVAMLLVFPEIALWLPNKMRG